MLCQSVSGTEPVEALECGHTFHTACIDEYVRARTRSLTRPACCPYKCHNQVVEMIDSDLLSDEAASSCGPAPASSATYGRHDEHVEILT